MMDGDSCSTTTALVVCSEDGGGGTRELSEDEIVEIFTRLPVKSLMRFRCTSKHWYNLILSPSFISMHSALGHRNYKPVILRINFTSRSVTETNITYRFEEEDLVQELRFNHRPIYDVMHGPEMVGCSNGVVCLSLSKEPQNYALWNPATRQVKLIAIGENGLGYSSGFCFDPVTNSFKVAMIHFTATEEEGAISAHVQVFSTVTNSWTEKNMIVPYPVGILRSDMIRGARCVNGYMHWHIVIFRAGSELEHSYTYFEMTNEEEVEDMYILSYDVINEAFERIEMPFRHVSSAQYLLAAYRGSLALFVLSSSVIDVWVLDRSSSPSWSKIPTCKPSIEFTHVARAIGKDDVGFIVLYSKPNSAMYLYDPLNGETKEPYECESTIVIFLCCESLASLN